MKSRTQTVTVAAVTMLVFAVRTAAPDPTVDEDLRLLKRTSKAFAEVARKALPAVVFIQVEKVIPIQTGWYGQLNDPFDFFGDEFFQRFFGGRARGRRPRYVQMGQGSGFIISPDGYILTNNHVVGDADKITVRLHDGREFAAKRIGTDPKSEVALIKIEASNLPFLEMGDSSALEIGEWVIAVGTPFGLTETVTVGVVSAKGRSNLGIAEYEDFIQTDAAINPGNSGGPLLNIEGKVVGINTAIFSGSGGYMGIGFAIPINMALAVKDQLIKKGRVTRGYLGVELNREEMTESLAESFGLKEVRGVLVAEVEPGSPAEKAGLKEGDIILKVGGKEVPSSAAFRNMIALFEPGTKTTLTIFRDRQEKELPVIIGAIPGESDGTESLADILAKLGFQVRDVTPEIARRFGYDSLEGVIVTEVQRGSLADRAEIMPGQVIVSVNRNLVRNMEEFQQRLVEAARGRRILLRLKTPQSSWFVLLQLE